jgi:hypothetical protein
MGALLRAITQWCCHYPWRVIIIALIIFGCSLWTLAIKISVITDTDAMIDPTLDYRQAYSAYKAAFPALGDNVAIVITGPSPEIRARTAATLAARLSRDTEHFKNVYAPTSLPYLKQNGLLLPGYDPLADQLDALVAAQPLLGPILREPSLDGLLSSLAEAQREAATDEDAARITALLADLEAVMQAVLEGQPRVLSFQNALLGAEGRDFDIVTAQPFLDPDKVQPAKAAMQVLSAHIQAAEQAAGGLVDVAVTGKIALNFEELKTVSSGAANAGLLSAVFVALVLFFGVRSGRAVAAMLVNLVFGLAVTGAAALWVFGSLNIISVAFAVLFIGLGIDFSIHILLRAREDVNAPNIGAALANAAGTSGVALALCAPTTALAFLSFTATGYAGLAQLGVIAAMGVVVALVSALTLLPCLLVLFGLRSSKAAPPMPRKMPLSPGAILVLTALAIVPAFYWASSMGFNADPIALKDASAPSVVTYQKLASRDDSSPYALQLLASDAQAAQAIVRKAEAMNAIGRILWVGRFVPEDQDDKLELIAETYDLLAADLATGKPAGPVNVTASMTALEALAQQNNSGTFAQFSSAAKAQPALLANLQMRVFETLPDLRDVLRQQLSTQGVQLSDVPAEITERYIGRDQSYRVEVFPAEALRDEMALEAFVEEVRAVFPSATGSPVQIIESGRIVQRAMLQATAIAFVLVTVFLWFVLKSFRQIFFVLCPVVLAATFTLATASLLGLNFNFANVIVLPLLIGLGVDAGIHYVKRAFERQEEMSKGQLETGTTGRAVFLSAITTVGSFGTLMISGHDGTASMGQLLTIALIWLLVTTLIILPALLIVVPQRKTQ